MGKWSILAYLVCIAVSTARPIGAVQAGNGSIRGVVFDKDFDAPLSGALVRNVELERETESGDQGNFVFGDVPPGTYTLIFSKDGYVREVRGSVVVEPGRLTELEVKLAGDFTEMEEFVVRDVLQVGAGSETALLNLRFESPALMDSIGSELMSRAGASDAASALLLVPGATVQDGKTAVIRGLPDRYVSSQMNGVRLPSADEDKRAVELDQFPAAVIESVQVAKTFTPDQQGDASGGAVNVKLKGIPDETIFQIKGEISANSQVTGRDDFLSYEGGGVNTWGIDDGGRDIQWDKLGSSWDGAVGTSPTGAPTDFKWSIAAGGKQDLDNGVRVGGFGSFFYERDSQFFDNGVDNSLWVVNPGDPLTPETLQGTPQDGDFKTALFDVTQGKQGVQWGGLGTLGAETENHSIGLTFLYTRSAEDKATLAEDTRGKEYFFPGYDPNNPTGTGNEPDDLNAAPYIRTETLEYTERTTQTLQLRGQHILTTDDFALGNSFTFTEPKVDWFVAGSSASLNQPDKRQFGALWLPASFNPGAPPFVPPFTTTPTWYPFKPAANFNLGNVQRIWKTIDEESKQVGANIELPFEQWSGESGFLKFGLFADRVDRAFTQQTFSNFGDAGAFYEAGWDMPWSEAFPSENHPITASDGDINYDGQQDISAVYGMASLPLDDAWSLVGGARFESTQIKVQNKPEDEAQWFPPGATAPVALPPGDTSADVDFSQDDILPSLGVVYEAIPDVTLRASYSQTIARQTFKELTPIIQSEFLGGPVFIGNPSLGMSNLRNYDLRADYTPFAGGLVSASVFYKEIADPIEYVQRLAGFTYTTPVNYPKGKLGGLELEVRQDLGHYWESVTGLTLGGNATFLDSEVTLSDQDQNEFNLPNIQAPMSTREMTGAPDYLYNLYATYDLDFSGTQFGIFYTVKGDTLLAGAGVANGNFIPSIYGTAYDTLNVGIRQKLGKHFMLQIKGKNLTNPNFQAVYRSPYTGADALKTSYSVGMDFSISLSASFAF